MLYNALTGEVPYPRGTVPATMLAHMQDDAAAADRGRRGVPGRLRPRDRPRARQGPGRPLPVGRRPRPRRARRRRGPARDRESERTVARGAAAPRRARRQRATAHRGRHGRRRRRRSGAAAAASAPTPKPRTHAAARRPAAPPAPRARAPRLLLGLLAAGAAGGGGRACSPAGGARRPAAARPARRSPTARSRRSRSDFADAYGEEDGAALGRLLTRDAERVVPGARQEGRAAVLRAYRRQFADSETRSFELARPRGDRRARPGRATARFVATYAGEPDVTGTIVFGVLRDRGTPRIALISARQDTEPTLSSRARPCSVTSLPGSTCVPAPRPHSQTFGSPGRIGSKKPPPSSCVHLQAEALELLLRGVGVAADDVGDRHAHLAHDRASRRSPGGGRAAPAATSIRFAPGSSGTSAREAAGLDGDLAAEHLDVRAGAAARCPRISTSRVRTTVAVRRGCRA